MLWLVVVQPTANSRASMSASNQGKLGEGWYGSDFDLCSNLKSSLTKILYTRLSVEIKTGFLTPPFTFCYLEW